MLNNNYKYRDAIHDNHLKGCDSGPCQCQSSCCCCVAIPGPQGLQGPTGPTGPRAFTPAYGAFYNNEILEAPAGALPLTTYVEAPPVGLSHTQGAPTVTVLNAGVYSVTYGVSNSGNTPFQLRRNGVIIPGSIISPIGAGYNSGGAILALNAGDRIEIVLTEPTITTIVRVFMEVIKVSQ